MSFATFAGQKPPGLTAPDLGLKLTEGGPVIERMAMRCHAEAGELTEVLILCRIEKI
jgi:hypothetical protein